MKPTVGSLFAGIGGIDLGFEQAGFETVWQVERDEYCRRVLAKNFPAADRSVTDVRDAGKYNLKPVDVIVGGDPCQRNSNACRNGGGEESPAPHFLRIVSELLPRIVLRENPSRVRSDAPWPWFTFRRHLEALGYCVLPFRLRACCVGVDCERERLFLLATLSGAYSEGLEGNECEELAREIKGRQNADIAGSDRRHPTPRICGRADAIPHRMDRLRALGNSVAPTVAYQIALRIREAMERAA
jgi:site-specific DNA-cytosine methylase